MSEQQLRIGIVGCGYQGGKMAQAVARTASLRVTACADVKVETAATLAARVGGVSSYESVDALLEEADVDAVIVATPHDGLAPSSLKAIRAGKHVLAEKPIGLNEAEAGELGAAVQRAGVCYMAGYSFRFFPAMRSVRELLAAGVIGELQTIAGRIGSASPKSGWKADPAKGGGALLFLGSHLVDQVLWLVGDDPSDVCGWVRRRADTGADETTVFQLRFADGISAQCLVSQTSGRFSNTLDLWGNEGNISVRGFGMGEYEIAVWGSASSAYAEPTLIRPRLADDRTDAMHVPQLEEFAAAIRERRSPSVCIADGRSVLRVTDAVVRSDQTGSPVLLA
jgi:predicted dehydrogenase